MHLKVFPLEFARQASTVCYNTTIIEGANGQEVRNANWQDPLYKFNAAFALQTKADVNLLQAFFHSVRGRETAFLVKDYVDFEFSQNIHGVADNTPDGVKTEFQMFKIYQDELGNFIRRDITKPVEDTTVATVTNPVQAFSYTVDLATGIIEFSGAPATGSIIHVAGEFYVPVRFDIDELPSDLLHYWIDGATENALLEVPEIPLREVRGE